MRRITAGVLSVVLLAACSSGASPPSPSKSLLLVDGVPPSIDGQPVLRADDLRAAIASSRDDAPFLAGGWLQSHGVVRSCPMEPVGYGPMQAAVDMCGSFGLYDQPVRGLVIWVAHGDPGLLTPGMIGVDRPVVLELHTHDTRCQLAGCAEEPVLGGVAWLGDIGIADDSLAPHPTRPPTSITQDQAIAKALTEVSFPANSSIRSVNEELRTEALPNEWPLQVDPWVWAIVAVAPVGRSALVVLDYATGAFIESQSPAP